MSEIRDMIADSINRMFAETIDKKLRERFEEGHWPEDLWNLVEEGGFTKVLAPESAGGTGGGWPEAYPVLHAVGYHQAPLPLAETVVANGMLGDAGLPIPDGPVTLIPRNGGDSLRLALENGQLILHGSVKSVPWARLARFLVITGTIRGRSVLGVVEGGQKTIRITPGANIAREPRDKVDFDGCRCGAFAYLDARCLSEPATTFGALGRAVAMVGSAESVLRQSLRYANERIQFGRPIGKFQAIQHSLAILACEVTAAETAVRAACNAVNRGGDVRFDIAVAKIRAGQAAGIVAALAHQIHGAIGVTYEHTLHYATRRLWSWRAEFGSESFFARELGERAIQRGGKNFWRDLTTRATPLRV